MRNWKVWSVGFVGAGVLALSVVQAQVKPVTLTPQDYVDIQMLVASYSFALDTAEADGQAYANLFTPDGKFGDKIVGREAIRTSLLTRPRTLLTKHLSTNVMIDVESHDSASGISCLTMISTTPAEGAAPPHVSGGPMWFGEMQDRFVREDGLWKFSERRGSIQMKFPGAQPS